MNFTAPSLLWLLPAAGLPVLLHLLSLRRARRIPFGDLTLLRQIQASSLPRTRLRSWLLVAARCLLLALIILAYAGPVLESPSQSDSQHLDLVILLDSSYSMGRLSQGKSRFQRSIESGVRLIKGLKDGDRVSVGVFSSDLEDPQTGLTWTPREEARERLETARVGFGGTDYRAPLKAAFSLFNKDKSTARRIVLILSDDAAHGLPAAGKLPAPGPDVTLLAQRWPDDGSNAFVATGGPSSRSTLRSPRFTARVASDADEEQRVVLETFLEGRRVSSAPMKLTSSRPETLDIPLPQAAGVKGAAAWSGRLSLRPDALKIDDTFFFSFRHDRSARVLVLYGDPRFLDIKRGGYFLKELCGPGGASLIRFECEFAELGLVDEARFSEYQAIVVADFKRLGASVATRLQGFVKRGGGLWVLPGPETASDGFSSLNGWLPARYGIASASFQPMGLTFGKELERWKGFQLDRVSVRRRHRLSPAPGAKVVLASSAGDPLLVSGVLGRGRVMVWASSLAASWSNLGVKPVFAAWVEAILEGIAPSGDANADPLNLGVGDPIIRVWGAREAVPAKVTLKAPDGRRTVLWVKDRRIEYTDTLIPGLYSLIESGPAGGKKVYAVNIDRSRESDLSLIADPPWKTLSAETLQEDWRLILYGRPIREPLVAAAIFFLILEMILALPWSWKLRTLRFRKKEGSDPGRTAAALKSLFFAAACVGALGAAEAGAVSLQVSKKGVGDRFVWTQLDLGESSDPYPKAWSHAVSLLGKATSVLVYPERRIITLKDPELFFSPLVLLAGRQAPRSLDGEEMRNLRHYLSAGGLLWIEDTSGTVSSSFDRWVRALLPKILPGASLKTLAPDHVVYKTFFLLSGPAGRVMVRGSLEGVDRSGRLAVIYSRNDLLGVWEKDALGRPVYQCIPGGEAQRHNARKMTLNILMYSMTGSYKSDAVHQPFLLRKMRRGTP